MFKNAFISVSNKEGLLDFVRPLTEKGMRVVSTGGTACLLKAEGISVVEVKEETGFAEVMDGRVKSLHPRIYMPLLSRLNHPEDEQVLKKEGLSPFDLVVCNLYPFKEKALKGEGGMEWVDVGGPSLLRAAAKNFERVTVLCDPTDYDSVLSAGKFPDLEQRKKLAEKVFSLLADYNLHIAKFLKTSLPFNASSVSKTSVNMSHNQPTGSSQLKNWKETGECFIKARFYKDLRYGENPNQNAGWFQIKEKGLHQAKCLQGKKGLSFNNICDLDSAINVLREFENPCAVAVKHNNPCGVACGDNIEQAVMKALKVDPVSVFGAVVALNCPISKESAEALSALFLSAVIAPDYTDSALELFKNKRKNLLVLKWPEGRSENLSPIKFRFVDGGLLVQEGQKLVDKWPPDWQYVGERPNSVIQSELLMAWKICSHLKSNSIALVSNGQTVGLGMGEVSRISAVENALHRWKKFHPHSTPVLASDGFFPFPDSIAVSAKAGIKWVIQPGGSMRDKEVFLKAKSLSVNMVITGLRCFSH